MAATSRKFFTPRLRRRVNAGSTYVFLGVFLIYFLIPLIWLVISSTKTNAGLFSTFGLWFGGGFHFFQNL